MASHKAIFLLYSKATWKCGRIWWNIQILKAVFMWLTSTLWSPRHPNAKHFINSGWVTGGWEQGKLYLREEKSILWNSQRSEYFMRTCLPSSCWRCLQPWDTSQTPHQFSGAKHVLLLKKLSPRDSICRWLGDGTFWLHADLATAVLHSSFLGFSAVVCKN